MLLATPRIRIQIHFKLLDFPLRRQQARCGGRHHLRIQQVDEANGFLQRIGGPDSALALDNQALSNPLPQFSAGCKREVVAIYTEIVARRLRLETLCQQLMGELELNPFRLCRPGIEQSLQAHENARCGW